MEPCANAAPCAVGSNSAAFFIVASIESLARYLKCSLWHYADSQIEPEAKRRAIFLKEKKKLWINK